MAGFCHGFMGLLGLIQGEYPVGHRPDLAPQQGPDFAQQGITDGAFLFQGAAPQSGCGERQPLGQDRREIPF